MERLSIYLPMRLLKNNSFFLLLFFSSPVCSQDLIYTGYVNQDIYIELYLNIQSHSQITQEIIGELFINNDLSQSFEVRGDLWKDGRLQLTIFDLLGNPTGYFNIFQTGSGTWKDINYTQTLPVQIELKDKN